MDLRRSYFFQLLIVASILFWSFFIGIESVKAAYERYSMGDTAVIGEFVYDDNFVATTTAACTVSIYNPSNTLIVNAASMTSNANGWTYYNYSIPGAGPEGTWPTTMTCGSVLNGDLVKVDKTFVVGATFVSTTTLANSIWSSPARSVTSFGTLVADIWLNGTRTLTSAAAPSTADIWSYASRNLTSATLDSGSLAVQSDVTTASSSIAAAITNSQTAINANTNSTVLTASTSLGSAISNTQTAINSNTNSVITTATSSLGSAITNAQTVINANTNTLVNNASTSIFALLSANISTASSSLASYIAAVQAAINSNTNSTVLNASTSIASTINTTIEAASSSIGSAISNAQTAINANTNNLVANASSSIFSLISANISTASSSLASYIATVQTALNSTVSNASSSLAAAVTAAQTNINTNTNTIVLTASTSLGSTITPTSASAAQWVVSVSDFDTAVAGEVYRATLTTVYDGTLTDSANLPTVTVYDASRNVVVSGVSLTRTGEGTYEYSYSVNSGAGAGVWESAFTVTVDSGKTLSGNDYWNVVTSPAQVIINDVTDLSAPEVVANITITNEGVVGYEYQYEWCVVSTVNNACGGGNDTYYGLAAKYINPGEDFNTTLTSTVPGAGDYYFKIVAHFGTDSSTASRSFTATGASAPPSSSGGSSGGSTGGGGGGPPPTETTQPGVCSRTTDFTCDGKIDSIDFSILLYYWKTKPPFKNPHVDANKDGKIDSVDFSIMLYQWDRK